MRLIGVGVGPGDPELVTVKAVRVLGTAGRVFVPVLDLVEEGRAEATVRAHAAHDRIERLVFALNERHDAARRERHWDTAGARVAEWLRETGGVADVGAVHLRWIGHALRAECEIVVPADLSVTAAHAIAVDAEHRLIHAIPRLDSAFVHADPYPEDGIDHHAPLRHHNGG